LDFWKFIWVSGCAAVLIAAIPPSFQFATARLEEINKESDRKKNIEEFRNTYAKDFIERALSQDIELRIRFAEYFSYVAAGDFKKDWEGYLETLKQTAIE